MDLKDKLAHSLDDYQRILERWKWSLNQPLTEEIRDVAILRFLLCYEVAWKTAQAALRYSGLNASTPREAFSLAHQMGWSSNEVIWAEIIKGRNLAVHVYREENAEKLFAELAAYAGSFEELFQGLKDWAAKQP